VRRFRREFKPFLKKNPIEDVASESVLSTQLMLGPDDAVGNFTCPSFSKARVMDHRR